MNVCIFGAGKQGVKIRGILREKQIEVAAFLDNKKSGEVCNVDIYSVEKALELFGNNMFVIISMNDASICGTICNQLETYGLKRGKNYIIWRELVSSIQRNEESMIVHPSGMQKIYELYRDLEKLCRHYVFSDMDLTEDEQIFRLMFQLLGTGNIEAVYIRYYLSKCLTIQGDICEFGVAQGATSSLMAYEIRKTGKRLWLFDSFEGLSVPTEKDILKDDIFNYGSMEKYAFSMKYSIDEVKERLKDIDIDQNKIEIVPGFIEDTVRQAAVLHNLKCISFAYIDFDLYEPIRTALDFLHDRTISGSVIIVDDYNFFSMGAKTAVDEFLNDHKGMYQIQVPDECIGKFCIIQKS